MTAAEEEPHPPQEGSRRAGQGSRDLRRTGAQEASADGRADRHGQRHRQGRSGELHQRRQARHHRPGEWQRSFEWQRRIGAQGHRSRRGSRRRRLSLSLQTKLVRTALTSSGPFLFLRYSEQGRLDHGHAGKSRSASHRGQPRHRESRRNRAGRCWCKCRCELSQGAGGRRGRVREDPGSGPSGACGKGRRFALLRSRCPGRRRRTRTRAGRDFGQQCRNLPDQAIFRPDRGRLGRASLASISSPRF